MIKIAIDVMGGDSGPSVTLPAINTFLSKHENVTFQLFGNESIITSQLKYKNNVEIYDTGDNVVSNDEKPAHAVRTSKGTSMFEAINSVANGKSDIVVSSGNTGAYMALSKMLIGILDGISRPALVNMIPSFVNEVFGKTIMLDLGANIECSAEKLYQFAIMGNAVAKSLLNKDHPKVGLLNIGTERAKGTVVLQEAYELLSDQSCLNFVGFIEGNDISNGTVDVVVTDGFSGNIALKTIEGTVKFVLDLLKQSINSKQFARLGYLLYYRKVFNNLKQIINPASYNGAPFVGLKRPVIKSHGASSVQGFYNAISTAMSLVQTNFIDNVKQSLNISIPKCEACNL